MLALWSRATRTPGTCRCISCIPNTTAVTGRAGALGTKSPWAFGTPTSTFVYTAIFTAGLATDAKMKQKRNEQWDNAFAAIRQDMDEPSQQSQRAQDNPTAIGQRDNPFVIPIEELLSEDTNWNLVWSVAGNEMSGKLFMQQEAIEIEDITEGLWNLVQYDSRFPGAQDLEWPINTGPDLIRHYLPPQSLWSPDHMRRTALRRRTSWKKMTIQQLSIGALIQGLLADARVYELPLDKLAGISEEIQEPIAAYKRERASTNWYSKETYHSSSRREFLENMKTVEGLPVHISPEQIEHVRAQVLLPCMPHYVQDRDGDFYQICAQMNAAIKQLLNDPSNWKSEENAALTIAKICHNLLVSSAAPDVQTFNMLIVGLKRWKQNNLIDDIIGSFDACKIRPNELTCTAILEYFTQTNRPDEFSRFVAKMRGADKAIMLADPNVKISEASRGRLIRVDERKVYQKIHPTPIVFGALMNGVLKFAGFERAMEIYYEMQQDGWGLDVAGLTNLLIDCIYRVDWNGGLYVWEEISGIKRAVKRPQMTKAYSQMLALCTVTDNTVAFNQLLQEVASRGFDRKSIVSSSARTVRMVQRGKSTVAPAFTADNLLIAAPEYLADAAFAQKFEESEPYSPASQDHPPKHEEHAIENPDEVWSAWMAGEFGEPAKPQDKNE